MTYDGNTENGVPVFRICVLINFTEAVMGFQYIFTFEPAIFAENNGIMGDDNVLWADVFLLRDTTYTCVVGNYKSVPSLSIFTTKCVRYVHCTVRKSALFVHRDVHKTHIQQVISTIS